MIASFTADNQDRFQISLAPGYYSVSMKGRKSATGLFGPDGVDVVAGKLIKIEWECDAGTR